MSKQIASVARKFGSRLTIGAIAVGDGRYDALEAMVTTATEYGCHTFIRKSTLKAGEMSSAFQDMSRLMSESKLTVTDVKTKRQLTYRDLDREPKSEVDIYSPSDDEWEKYSRIQKTVYNRNTGGWENIKVRNFNNVRLRGVAVRKLIFGEGRERAVRRVREIGKEGTFIGPELVGKESLYVEDESGSISFHKTFCKVQQLAQKMAERFNRRLLALPGVDRKNTLIINFLDCHVMVLPSDDSPTKFLHVEKMLDHTKYKKWNTNAGMVDKSSSSFEVERFSTSPDCPFTIDEIPQAFSHFTYINSGRKFLICDLQGVLNTKSNPPVFEMTDPAIHYYRKMTSRRDFGRTDRGQEGIDHFLRTYKSYEFSKVLSRQFIKDPFKRESIESEDTEDILF